MILGSGAAMSGNDAVTVLAGRGLGTGSEEVLEGGTDISQYSSPINKGMDKPAATTSSAAGEVSLHVSLSRTLPVKFHYIPTLLEALKEGLQASG